MGQRAVHLSGTSSAQETDQNALNFETVLLRTNTDHWTSE